jgi:predicted phage tail protein
MIQIELCGILGKTFGKVHHRLISTTHEATRALAATIPGFEKFMISSQRRGLTYAVFKGKKNIGIDDLGFPVTGEVIRIVPVIMGSKRGGFFKHSRCCLLQLLQLRRNVQRGGTARQDL